MKCPLCDNPLRISKKDSRYGLCDNCRVKFRLPNSIVNPHDEEEHYPKYANIPPREVREKREREMRQAYDELLAIGKEQREHVKKNNFFRRSK